MSWIKIIFINLIVIFGFLVFIEAGFRVHERYLTNYDILKNANPKDFRASRPEPYKHSNYFSKDFIEESFKQPEGWSTPSGTRLIIPNNFKGNWFNYQNNKRVTVGQPKKYQSRILLFGGSTVQNSEVPDDFTIASFIQSKVASNNILVENYGVTSVHSGQQLERLKQDVRLDKNDTVIFYDGVNDVLQRAYYGNPDGWIINEVAKAPKVAKIIRGSSEYMAIFRWLDKNVVTKKFEYDFALAEKSAHDYAREIEAAKRYVESSGAQFIHFLQPTLFTKLKKNNYEENLVRMAPEGLELVYNTTYPLIRKSLKSSIDLTDIFDEMKESPYFDFCHVNEIGNERVAQEILKNFNR